MTWIRRGYPREVLRVTSGGTTCEETTCSLLVTWRHLHHLYVS